MTEPATTSQSEPLSLVRDLTLWQATAVVVGTVIGSGIFLVPKEMLQATGAPKVVYLAWIVGGALSFFGAMTYAELGAMKPDAGGEYVYIRDAYGRLPAFLYAWTWFVIAKPASIATVTAGVVRVISDFPALKFLHDPPLTSLPITYGQLVAIAIAWLMTGVNYIGIRRAGMFQLVSTILKVALITGIAVLGFAAHGSWSHFAEVYSGASGGIAGFMAALVAALWAYDGWNDLNMVGGEVRDPQRSIPFALLAGMGIIAVLYMTVNAAIQYALPVSSLAASASPAADAVRLAIGPAGAVLVGAAIALSMFVTVNGTIMSGGRVPYAMARDGMFFKALATVHPRFRTPSTSLLVQAALASVLILVIGTFKALFSLAIFAEWLFYMAAASTIFVYRRRNSSRPFSAWGYPLIPGLFIVAAGILLYYTFMANLPNSAAGLLLIASGVPIYLHFTGKKAAS